jgi:hypothetical protein
MDELTKICKTDKLEVEEYLIDYYQHINILLHYYDRKSKSFDKYFELYYRLMLHYKMIYEEMKLTFSLIKDWGVTDFVNRMNLYRIYKIHLDNIIEVYVENLENPIKFRNFSLYKNYKIKLISEIIPKSTFINQTEEENKLLMNNLYSKITIANIKNEQSVEIINPINREIEIFTFSFIN